MTRRVLLLMGVAIMLTAGGVWATLANANANTKAALGGCRCDTDPTCPPGCSPECPPDCAYCPALGLTAKGNVKKAVDCRDDLTCPPGCSPACPPDCLDLTAKAGAKTATKSSCCSGEECRPATTASSAKTMAAKKYICPPCPFCPGW
jgi:hypothetical protein